MNTFAGTIAGAAQQLAVAGIEDARLEAELLLAHAAGADREHVIAALRDSLDDEVARTLEDLLARRLRHEPLAYITGHREFYGLDLLCGPAALIPRPETEMLVDLALEAIRAHEEAVDVIDVGTGSGAIACAIAANAPDVRVLAVDASDPALVLARENAKRLRVAQNIELRRGDLLEGLGAFDVIVANLPYVSEGEWALLEPEVRDFEPKQALVPGPLGTEANMRLLQTAGPHMRDRAILALEIGADQARELREAANTLFPAAQVSVMKDLAGFDRVLFVRA